MTYRILIIACFISSIGYSQNKKFTFKLGTEYELPRRTEELAFFGNDQDGIVNLSLKKEELNIVRFDAQSLRKTSEKVIELPEVTKNFNSEEVAIMKNNYYWLHSDWDKDNEKEMLFYDKIDVATGKITEPNKKMFETTKLGGTSALLTGFYRYKVDGKYQFSYDIDQTKLLVSYRLYPLVKNDKKNYDKLGVQVFDEHMNKLWGREFTMPYTEAIMDNSDFSVDSKGNAYLLSKVYDNDSRKEKDKATGKPAYHFEVFKFEKDSKEIKRTSVSVGDYFIKQPSLIEDATHNMIIACTYSKKNGTNGTDGVFLCMVDQDGKVVKYKNGFYEFPLAELEKFESARSKRKMEKKDDYEAPDLTVRNVVIGSDGGVFIACEEFRVENNSYMDGQGHWHSYITYYYEDMLGMKINSSGAFEWLRKIPKKQKGGAGRGGMSFTLIADETGYHYLYLDNKKNMEMEEDDVPKYHVDGKGGQVVVATLDEKGTLTKELLFDTREEDIKVYPADFSRINGNQFIGRARIKKNLFQPLLITVK